MIIEYFKKFYNLVSHQPTPSSGNDMKQCFKERNSNMCKNIHLFVHISACVSHDFAYQKQKSISMIFLPRILKAGPKDNNLQTNSFTVTRISMCPSV